MVTPAAAGNRSVAFLIFGLNWRREQAKNQEAMDGGRSSLADCPTCRQLRKVIERQQRQIEQLTQRNQTLHRAAQADRRKIQRLECEIARLSFDRRLEQVEPPPTASNSSIPPSANPPGAPPPTRKKPTGRRSGAQPGHQGHGRKLLPTDQANQVIKCYPEACPQCGAPLVPSPQPRPRTPSKRASSRWNCFARR